MRLKRLFLLVLCLCMLLSLSSCVFYEAFESDGETETETQKYIVKVVTEGGMPLRDVYVKVFEGTEDRTVAAMGSTDSEGFYIFSLKRSDNYVAVLDGLDLSDGYIVEEEYPINSKDNEFSVKTALTDKPIANAELQLGDIAFDFEITDANGVTHKASEILRTKKAIVLNYWFENCGPCRMEFPYMQEAYAEYSESLEILALNPLDSNQQGVKKYAESLSLTFPMASVGREWQTSLKELYGYPTTVVIDRYGMVAFIHTSAITDKESFIKLFAYFTADDYVQKTVKNLSEIK